METEGPVGNERASSRWPQIAKQNRSTGAPEGRLGELCSTQPPSEHTILRSEVGLKGAAGGPESGHEVLSRTPDMSIGRLINAYPQNSKNRFNVLSPALLGQRQATWTKLGTSYSVIR